MTHEPIRKQDSIDLIREAIKVYESGEPEPLIPSRHVAALLADLDKLKADIGPLLESVARLEADLDRVTRERDEALKDARRYRWLREQHEGQTDLENDADGFPMPLEPTALAYTVFKPGDDLCLEPVGCIPGELDAAIDAALRVGAVGEQKEPA